MIRINMTSINLFRTQAVRTTPATCDSVTWGKNDFVRTGFNQTASTLIFAALLIFCSLAVGCSSEQPKPVSSASASPMPQPEAPTTMTVVPATPAPTQQAAAKPVHKKVVRRAPPTIAYVDKTSGVSFQYPRKYSLKTGEAANELVESGSVPTDFVQPGGVALAAVALPESTYPNSDLNAAFFNVSVNKNLTADQCSEFSVPQPQPIAPADGATEASMQARAQLATPPISKLLIGDMELQSSPAVAGDSGNGKREETAKYYHVFQNGACYEFALKVATNSGKSVEGEIKDTETEATTESAATKVKTEAAIKHVDRDEVFRRLEKILATVKVNPVTTPEVNDEAKASAQPASTEQAPAQ
jgi:hypothetical protein